MAGTPLITLINYEQYTLMANNNYDSVQRIFTKPSS